MPTFSVEDLNEAWVVERVINLLDQARNDDAQAIAREWSFDWDGSEGGATP